jgi:tetratricopeptide (TPR) repeat protein
LAQLIVSSEHDLSLLAPAKAADALLIERLKPQLVALHTRLTQLIASLSIPAPTSKPTIMFTSTSEVFRRVDDRFDEGLEYWHQGDRKRARTIFRAALKIDPNHADANNHLGIVELERAEFEKAEARIVWYAGRSCIEFDPSKARDEPE